MGIERGRRMLAKPGHGVKRSSDGGKKFTLIELLVFYSQKIFYCLIDQKLRKTRRTADGVEVYRSPLAI